jgi:hypothetical protein
MDGSHCPQRCRTASTILMPWWRWPTDKIAEQLTLTYSLDNDTLMLQV